MSRRLMLIGSGGLMLGLATVVGCAPSKLAASTLDAGPEPNGEAGGRGLRGVRLTAANPPG